MSRYIDNIAIIQVIGNVYNNPHLLEYTDKYLITELDFPDDFHKVVFGSIFKLYELGASKITIENINDFLESRPKSQAIFNSQKGEEWLIKASDAAMVSSFDYYYNRMKKMSLLRSYSEICGMDLKWLYDPDNILDMKKRQQQEEFIDNCSLSELVNKINDKIDEVRSTFLDNVFGASEQVGKGLSSLVESFKEHPEVGVPLYGSMVNAVTRGARLKKFYLRSAPTGVGKSRTLAADACYIACNRMYDTMLGWISIGEKCPAVFITTEQEISEVQTMMLAFISDVDEDHILNGRYMGDEATRITEAIKVLEEAPLYIEELPDFSLMDVENCIKRHIRDHNASYIFLDYLHTSMKILEEISKRSGGVKLREDNILFMLSIRLKDLCNEYGVFIESATQLSGDWRNNETPDQSLLRGAKSIADKIDYGAILLPVNETDQKALEPIVASGAYQMPNLKISIYKNRRGRYKGIYLWCDAHLSTCRVNPMFATDWTYELQEIQDIKIITAPSAF